MKNDELLKNEKVEKVLSPHPLSFMGYQALSIYLIIWGIVFGWIVNYSDILGGLIKNFWFLLAIWAAGLLIAGIIASLITVRWSIFFLYLSIFGSGIVLIFWLGLQDSIGVFAPFYSVFMSIAGFLVVEVYRRSHKYIISNQRISFRGGILTKRERTLRYDKISDINAKQSITGQIFGFGTITPISQSGFGLGTDTTQAAGGVMLGEKKAKIFGIFGGGREVQTPRARSYYELHGVYPYKEIKKLVEAMVQGSVITSYQKEQVSFQKEQVDIQKQMRDLLKMQSDSNDEGEEEGENIEKKPEK
jgi:membrane protein YdbS with pleckstrin-like domain